MSNLETKMIEAYVDYLDNKGSSDSEYFYDIFIRARNAYREYLKKCSE